MSFQYILSDLAKKELENSVDWYEEQQIGLGLRFIEAIDGALTTISADPEMYPQKKAPFREFRVKVFPFIIIYEILQQEGTIEVLHVFHKRRNPKFKYKRR